MGFLLCLGWIASAEPPPLNTKADITCYKDKTSYFKLKTGTVKQIGMSNTFENVIEGTVDTPSGSLNLLSSFPYLEIESNATMLMIEPTVTNPFSGLLLDYPTDLEITIDLQTHLGRFSAVANSTQAGACAGCDGAVVVECTN